MSKGKRSRGKRKGKRSKPAVEATANTETETAAEADEPEAGDDSSGDDSDEPRLRPEVIVPDDDDDEPPARTPRAEVVDIPAVAALSRIDRLVGVIELVLVSLFLASLIGTAVYQFIASKFFKTNDNWPFEVIRYSVFFVAMSAAALAAQQKKMMAIDFVPRLLRPKTRAVSRVLIGLMVVFVCYLFIRGGLMVRDSIAKTTEHYDVINPVTGALAMPIGAALIGFHFLNHAIIDLIYLGSGKLPPEDEGISVH